MQCSYCSTKSLICVNWLPTVLNGGKYILCKPCTQLKITPASFTKDQKFDGVFAEEEKENPDDLGLPPMPKIPQYYWEDGKRMPHAPWGIMCKIIIHARAHMTTTVCDTNCLPKRI